MSPLVDVLECEGGSESNDTCVASTSVITIPTWCIGLLDDALAPKVGVVTVAEMGAAVAVCIGDVVIIGEGAVAAVMGAVISEFRSFASS
jgi:hypothetical protein